MASLTALPLAAIAFTLLFILAFVSLACGIVLLIIKLANKKAVHPKLTVPLSVFLIANGVVIIVSILLYITKFAALLSFSIGRF